MKPLLLATLSFFLFLSCNEGNKNSTRYLPKSVGTTNTLQIITPNELWNGSVGEEIRKHFAAPADGLPQDEPLYGMNQMPPEAYSGFARNYRLFLHASLGDEDKVSIATNEYAKPQKGVIITATSREKLIELIQTNAPKILEIFQETEIKEKQRQIGVSLKKMDSLKRVMGVTLKMSSAYRLAQATDSFFWYRKDLENGTTNVLIYEIPLSMISGDSASVGEIIKIRDSIGSKYLPVEDDDKFITEEAYAPYLFTTKIDGKFAYETKGTWEVKDVLMAGPFLNYAIRDEANDRYLILEGFTYAPSGEKRNLQFELEAILKSAKIE